MTDNQGAKIEAAARAIAKAWNEQWECDCEAQRGLDCDCGYAMTDDRDDLSDDRLCRDDCYKAARAVLSVLEPPAHNRQRKGKGDE